MKTNILKNIRVLAIFVVCLTVLGVGDAWGAANSTTYTFTGSTWTATSGGNAANWTSGKAGAGFSNNGIQVTSTVTGANGTSPVSFSNVTKVILTYNTNKSSGSGTIYVKVGSNTAKSASWGYGGSGDGRSANYTATIDYTTPESGYVQVTCSTTTNSIYLVSAQIFYGYTVTYDKNGGSGTITDTDSPYASGATVTVKSNSFTAPDGKTFNGWNTAPGGGGTSYAAGATFSISAHTTLYAQWASAASCDGDADMSSSAASLKGSFTLSSVGVTVTGMDKGDNCSWSEAGFVWSPSSNTTPTVGGTNCDTETPILTSGTATTCDGTLTGSFSLGNTYYYRAYGKNNYGSATYQYSAVQSFIPRSVTFNLNGHGSSTPSTQYVNDGGKASDPSYSESVTGWAFGGWYDNSDWTQGTQWNFGTSTVSDANVTLYAKWTEKPKYTITLNAGNGTVSADGWTAGSSPTWSKTQANGDEAITFPEASCNCAGWNFVGWATSSASNAGSDPTSKTAGSTLTPASNVTYYAVYQQSTPGGTTYNKITSTGDLTTGEYVFASSSGYAMSKTVVNDRMSEKGSSYTGTSVTVSADTLRWLVVKFGSQVLIRNKNNSKFLGIDKDGYITCDDNPHLWTFTYNTTNSRWEFTSATYTSYQLIYNSYFKAGTTQSTAIYLYKQGAVTGNYYTSPSCSDYTVSASASPIAGGTVYQSATSVASGGKIYVYCTIHKDYNFDGWTISGTGVSPSSASTQFVEITAGSANVTATANYDRKDWHVQWKVNGVELTGSDLGDAQNYYDDDEWAKVLPPNPSSCDDGDGASDVFVGWTTNTWGGKSTEPAVLFKNGRDAPVINADVTYHAVFAKESSTTYKRITSTKYIGLDSKIVIVNNSSEKALKNDYSAVDVSSNLSADDATLSSVSSDWVWTAKSQDSEGYYILKNGSKQLGINKTGGMTSSYSACGDYSTVASAWDLWEASDDSEFNTTTSDCFYLWNWATASYYNFLTLYSGSTWESKYYANSSSKGNPTASENAMRLYIPEYTNYLISCCTAYDITLTGSGTVTGGTIEADPTSACEGAAVTLAATPSTGYTFTEWTIYKDDDDSDVTSDVIADGDEDESYVEMTMPDYDVTVDATFTAKEYDVVLDKNGGTSDGEATATYNSSSLSSVTHASYTGYTLLGYYTETSGGDMVITANGALVASVGEYTDANAKWIYDDDEVFAAHWKPNGTWNVTITAPSNGTITVTYNSGASSMTSGSAYIGGTITISASGNTGYELATNGLKVNGTTFTSGNSLTLSEDITISATFSLKKHNVAVTELSTVTISAGDIDEGENDDVDYGSSLTLSYSAVTSGHYWSGWKVTNEGGDDVTDDVVSGSTLTVPDYDIIVTAKIYGDVKAWCVPTFNVTGDVHLTSTAGVYVNLSEAADNLINFSGSDLYSVSKITINYLDGNGDEVAAGSSPLRLYGSGGTSLAEGNIISFPGGAYNQDYSVRLTVPAATYNTEYNYKLLLKIYKGSRIIKTVEHPMNGRALPEEFVIAVKSGDQWYALPSNLASTSSQPSIVPFKISVDNSSAPTAATYAPTTAAYKATGRNAATKYMNGIRFTTTGSNYLQTAKADGSGNYNMWLSTSNSDSAQVWYLSSTDFGAYTLKMDAKHNGTKKMGIYTGGYMGFHGSPSASDIYLLPITTKYNDVPATASEWGAHGVIVQPTTPSDLALVASASMNIGTADPTAATTTAINAIYGTAKRVKVDGGALTVGAVANEGKSLYIHWKNSGGTEIGVSQLTIPTVIAESNDMYSIATTKAAWAAKSEVHVLPDVTLEANAGSFTGDGALSVSNLHLYPGATLKVSTGTFNATTLRMHNGWTRAGTKKYDVARVYIADDAALTKTTASMDYDIYESTDGRHYYPLAVPFETAVNSIDYADSWLAGYSNYSTNGRDGQYAIKTYNGQHRADYGGGVVEDVNNWSLVPAGSTLKPGHGYIMTAVPVYGEAIIRVPLTFDNAWTSDGEKGEVTISAVNYKKDTVHVTGYNGAAARRNSAHIGWNLLGVPFMSCYKTGEMYDDETEGDATLLQGRVTIVEDRYQWNEEDVVYVSVPVHDFSEYVQTDITEAKLQPGWCFFVQVDTSGTGTLHFWTDSLIANNVNPIYAPKRETDDNRVNRTGIVLSGAEASDKTTILVSNKYNSNYEVGADLEKMFGEGYTLAVYSLSNETRLAFNAMSPTDAVNVIPIGFRAPADGEYTFSLNQRYADAPFERVDLIDYQLGTLTNLLNTPYTFSTTRTQDDTRFALNVIPRQETPTDIENGSATNGKPEVKKVIINDKMYIILGDEMYDATGKRVKLINQ